MFGVLEADINQAGVNRLKQGRHPKRTAHKREIIIEFPDHVILRDALLKAATSRKVPWTRIGKSSAVLSCRAGGNELSVAEYIARLHSYVEGKDPIAILAETPAALARLITRIPEEKLNRAPTTGKWSLAGIVAHLAEAEIALSWRYRQIVEKEDAALAGYDQNLWYRLGDYDSRDSQESLTEFRLLREANLRMFARFTPDDWRRSGIHAERGRLTMKDLLIQAAGHDLSHLAQAERVVAVVSE